jgi:D-serine deaminase-like pyridoxal phosphate-dependent protein
MRWIPCGHESLTTPDVSFHLVSKSERDSVSPGFSRPSKEYKIGDLLEVIVPHCDPVANEFDQMYGIRMDKVEVVWTITGRGKSQ